MFESNVHCQYSFSNGSGLVTDTLFGLKKVPDDTIVTQDSVAMGFDCSGVPPEPRVCVCIYVYTSLYVYRAPPLLCSIILPPMN